MIPLMCSSFFAVPFYTLLTTTDPPSVPPINSDPSPLPSRYVPSVSTDAAWLSRVLMEEHVKKIVTRLEDDSCVIVLHVLLAMYVRKVCY